MKAMDLQEIIPGLFLGSAKPSKNAEILAKLNITCIVNLAGKCASLLCFPDRGCCLLVLTAREISLYAHRIFSVAFQGRQGDELPG
jgi:hypothetical protein